MTHIEYQRPPICCLVLLVGFRLLAMGAEPEDILDPIPGNPPKPNYGVAVPSQVSGRVITGTHGVEGVSVTDGYSVVKTDAQGAYKLNPSPDAVFIYITKPSGYDVAGDWYRPVAAEVDFSLSPAALDEHEYTFVHVSDTHISTSRRSVEGLSRFVREVNALTPRPRFVVNSGDLVNLDKTLSSSPATGHAFFRNYVGTMNHLAMPCYNVAGDHTDSSYRLDEFPRGDLRCGKPMYWEYLGPHFFSFEYGRIHYVSVDFTAHLGKNQIRIKGEDKEYPTNEVQPAQVEWMKQDMGRRAKGTFVVTTAESDLSRFCPGFIEMAENHDVRLQLTGDDHIVAYHPEPVPYRTGGSLSGCWWNPKTGDLCPDLSPAGYLVYRVKGEQMECFYKGLGRRVDFTAPRVGAPWQETVTVQAQLVQPRPDEALEYSLDGETWHRMRETGRPFYRAIYEATLDSTRLPDGLVDVRVRSTANDETRQRAFVVANGHAPAASTDDATLIFRVNPSTHVPKTPDGDVEVLFNDKVVGVLAAKARRAYTFPIPASGLLQVNLLRFRFALSGDGMGISAPVLTIADTPVDDPRHAALRQVRKAHWGDGAAEWGGFIVGDGKMRAGPFARKQNTFCFVLPDAEMKPGKPKAAEQTPAKLSATRELFIWREAEEIATTWGRSGYTPAEERDNPNWQSGKGAAYTSFPGTFTWSFQIKEEIEPDTLLPKTRAYSAWVRLYGYRQRPSIHVVFDGKQIADFRVKKTETTDANGEYIGPGTYYWEPAGSFAAQGGTHALTFDLVTPPALIDAILLTTDSAYRPDLLEARDIADQTFFTDVSTHEIHPTYVDNGISDTVTTLILFDVKPRNGKAFYVEPGQRAVFHLLMPEAIEVRNITSHFAGQAGQSANAKRPFAWKQIVVAQRDGQNMARYEADLSYMGLYVGVHVQARKEGFTPGTRFDGECWLESDSGTQPPRALRIRTVHVPRATAFKTIFIGPCGGSGWIYREDFPGLFDTLHHAGINFYNPWTWHPRGEDGTVDPFVRDCRRNGISLAGEVSPLHGSRRPKDATEHAMDINGKRTRWPSLCLSEATLGRSTDLIRRMASSGVAGMSLDDENYNQVGDRIDYDEPVKQAFRAYLAAQTDLTYEDPAGIVRNKEQKTALYDAWVDFKCDRVIQRWTKYRAAFDEGWQQAAPDHKGAEPYFIAQILKNKTPRESKTNTFWDYKRLAEICTHLSPMVYNYGSIRHSHTVGDVVAMYTDHVGRNVIVPTMLTGHGRGGEVLPANKPTIKYQIIEALIHKAPGVLFWTVAATLNAVNLAQVSEAIRLTQPYEDILLDGEACKDLRTSPANLRVRALKHGNRLLVYAADYDNSDDTDAPATVTLLQGTVAEVLDVAADRPVPVVSNGFTTDFRSDRGKLFLMSLGVQ